MLWTAPHRHASAKDVVAVEATTIWRSQTCKRSQRSVSISPKSIFQAHLFHAQVQPANQASISLEIFAQQRAELFWGARLGCERKAKQVLA